MPRVRKPIVGSDLKSYKRIPFGPEIAAQMPCYRTPRGWTHRRHILSQHFLREAWNAMASDLNLAWLRKVAACVVKVKERLPLDQTTMDEVLRMQLFASEILRSMNDNECNLFVDDGGENSGIGAFSHTMEALLIELLEMDRGNVTFHSAKGRIVNQLEASQGSWGQNARDHFAFVKTVAIPQLKQSQSYDDLVAWLEDLQYSTDLDLDKADGAHARIRAAISFRRDFLQFKNRKRRDTGEFARLICDFVTPDSWGMPEGSPHKRRRISSFAVIDGVR